VTRNAVASVRTHDICTNSDRQEFGKMKVLCSQVLHDELRCSLSSCPVAQQAAELYRARVFLLHANVTQF